MQQITSKNIVSSNWQNKALVYKNGQIPELVDSKQEPAINVNKLIFSESIVFEHIKMLILAFVYIVTFFCILALSSFFNIFDFLNLNIYLTFTFVFIVLLVIFLIQGFLNYIFWKNLYYEITPEAVTKTWGIFDKESLSLKTENISRIYVSQGILGRIFNYGSITIVDEAEKTFILYKIKYPEQKLHVIQHLLKRNSSKTLQVDEL